MVEVRLKLSFPLLLGGGLLYAYWTKPSEASFEEYLDRWLAEQAAAGDTTKPNKTPSAATEWITGAITTAVRSLRNKLHGPVSFKDYGVFRMATLQHDGTQLNFVGVAGHWYALHSVERMYAQIQAAGKAAAAAAPAS